MIELLGWIGHPYPRFGYRVAPSVIHPWLCKAARPRRAALVTLPGAHSARYMDFS